MTGLQPMVAQRPFRGAQTPLPARLSLSPSTSDKPCSPSCLADSNQSSAPLPTKPEQRIGCKRTQPSCPANAFRQGERPRNGPLEQETFNPSCLLDRCPPNIGPGLYVTLMRLFLHTVLAEGDCPRWRSEFARETKEP